MLKPIKIKYCVYCVDFNNMVALRNKPLKKYFIEKSTIESIFIKRNFTPNTKLSISKLFLQ